MCSVEKGEIVGSVQNTIMAGSIFEGLHNLVDLADQPAWSGGANLPSSLFH